MKQFKRCLCALLAVILAAGVLFAGLTGCANSDATEPVETVPPTTVPLSEALAGDIANDAKVSQDVAAKSIFVKQLSTAEAAPSFTFYKEGARLEGSQWAVTGKIRAETVADQEAQIYFVADKDSENQANIIINRSANGTNGIYQNRTVDGVRTPEEGNALVSRSLVDSTDWSAEFAFVFYDGTVSLYLKEPGEDFLLMVSLKVGWKTCTAGFSIAQNANVTLSELTTLTNHIKIKNMSDDLITPLENPIDSKRLLFIGNSGTAYKDYDLPACLTQLARNAGYQIEAGSVVLGNSNIAQHADATTGHGKSVLNEIAKGYDIVFLQELSSCICSDANRKLTLESSKILDVAIRAAGSQTAFFSRAPMEKATYADQTTARQCIEYDKLFTSVAEELGAMNVCVTRAYDYVIKNSNIHLWIEDRVHANDEGEYLTACVFFASLFNESATVLDYYGLEEDVAKTLQEAADAVVFDHYTIDQG